MVSRNWMSLEIGWISTPLSAGLIAFCLFSTVQLVHGGDLASPSASPTVTRGLISLIDDFQVPANRSGLVTSLVAKEGLRVDRDSILATIDMRQAELEAKVSQAEHETVHAKGSTDVEVRYARAALCVAQAELTSADEANRKVVNAVSKVEFDRLKLSVEQACLKVEAANQDFKNRRTETNTSQARLDLARLNVDQRQIRSPISGEVAEVLAAAGEWVEAGETLIRVVGLRHLRVETFVSVKDFRPNELHQRAAKIQVALARNSSESFVGKVTFVNPIVQPGGFYRVWIEVDNRREGEHWLLRPGLEVEVRIGD